MTHVFKSIKRSSATALIASAVLSAGAALTATSSLAAAPSGEPPRASPQDAPRAGSSDAAADPKKSKKPLLTVENRQAILADLYGQLATLKDPDSAKPLVDAIWKVWSFTGSATSEVLLERARAATEQGSMTDATAYLSAVTELQPDYPQAWFLRAMAFKLQKDSHRMLGDLRRTLALDPNHFEALKALAFELNERGERKIAMEAYTKLLQAYPAAAKSADPVLEVLSRDLGGQGI